MKKLIATACVFLLCFIGAAGLFIIGVGGAVASMFYIASTLHPYVQDMFDVDYRIAACISIFLAVGLCVGLGMGAASAVQYYRE